MPSRAYSQRQPITTTLRNICEHYPSNTCIRELLQNADDARATEIEFILDTTTYKQDELLLPGMAAACGPALLARNNSTFTETDLESLSQVGDSEKRWDPTTTGKFGQGFSSVYHWTDNPWVVSQDFFFALDPHETWSSEGGRVWDTVNKDLEYEKLCNTVKPFEICGYVPGKHYEQTIVRIPLRTVEQAETSRIVNNSITTEEIRQALLAFGADMQDGGLLFLKYIRKVMVRVNDQHILTADVRTDACYQSQRDSVIADFRELYITSISPPISTQPRIRIFESDIHYNYDSKSNIQHYVIVHCMLPLLDDDQHGEWKQKHKLFPWVAVAAPIGTHQQDLVGKLFSTLSLQIRTQQPVHIHGLFAIAPDRARLAADHLETEWNQMMFNKVVVRAWVALLEHRSAQSPSVEMFKLWPSSELPYNPGDPWTGLSAQVTMQVIKDDRPVWNATNGTCMPYSKAQFIDHGPISDKFGCAWACVKLPGTILEPSHFKQLYKLNENEYSRPALISPKSVRKYLKNSRPVQKDAVAAISEYCLQDVPHADSTTAVSILEEMKSIRCWPMLDGSIAAYDDCQYLLIPRNSAELALFSSQRRPITLDINELHTDVVATLLKHAGSTSLIRTRGLEDLAIDWPNMYVVQRSGLVKTASCSRDQCHDHLITNIWEWITKILEHTGIEIPIPFKTLWLLPLELGRVRQMVPCRTNEIALIMDASEDDGGFSSFLYDLCSENEASYPPIVDRSVMPAAAIALLLIFHAHHSEFRIASTHSLISLLQWLTCAVEGIGRLDAFNRGRLLEHLRLLINKTERRYLQSSKEHIARLPIFSHSSAVAPYSSREISAASIPKDVQCHYLPPDFPSVPDFEGVMLFSPVCQQEQQIITTLGLLQPPDEEKFLKELVLPWITATHSASTPQVKVGLADWIMQRPFLRDIRWQELISCQAIVPTSQQTTSISFRAPSDLVDPTRAGLYFPDEDCYPDRAFFKKHKLVLQECGLGVQAMSARVISDRIRCYASRPISEELMRKVHHLLKTPLPSDIPHDMIMNARNLAWLPASKRGDNLQRYTSFFCRANEHASLADYIFGIIPIKLDAGWTELLGWQTVPNDVALQQLDVCIKEHHGPRIKRILKFLGTRCLAELAGKKFVLGRHKEYRLPQDVVLPTTTMKDHKLYPFIDDVDISFAHDHEVLLKALHVTDVVSSEQLNVVMKKLKAGCPLDRNLMIVAVEAFTLAKELGFDAEEACLPDTEGMLRKMSELVQGRPSLESAGLGLHHIHDMVPTALIKELDLETVDEQALRVELDLEDDGDDFEPRENLCTTINDTLTRYPVDTTFTEFLANADDAAANAINWSIDPCFIGPYPAKRLLTKEMAEYQGASLVVHNDALFSDSDFEGFKNIGHGGKIDDATTTGMFGRGVMTMYHFTDVPMLITGSYFVVLDPHQRCLPRKGRSRKVGLKKPLSIIRKIAPDQLVPFEGIHGFDSSRDYYDGTIFRFPLRTCQESLLKDGDSKVSIASVKAMLEEYADTARRSLLFLSNIRSISFSASPKAKTLLWSVSQICLSSDEVFYNVRVQIEHAALGPRFDLWRVGMKDIEDCPADVVKVGKSFSKITECGLAANLLYDQALDPGLHGRPDSVGKRPKTNGPDRYFYCRLPTDFKCYLPVSIHASFGITGDRKSIPHDDRDERARFNDFLLSEAVPSFYFEFIADVGTKYGAFSFDVWPTSNSSHKLQDMSTKVCRAFWTQVVDDRHYDRPLFPLHGSESSKLNGRTDLTKALQRPKRKLYGMTSLKNGCFNMGLRAISSTFKSLCRVLKLNLVLLPGSIARMLGKNMPKDQLLKIDMDSHLATIFKEDQNCLLLERFLTKLQKDGEKEKLLKDIYTRLIPVPGLGAESYRHLDGCRIVPRPDLNLPFGILNVTDDDDNAVIHVRASKVARRLFFFAQQDMVHPVFPMIEATKPVLREALEDVVLYDGPDEDLTVADRKGGVRDDEDEPTLEQWQQGVKSQDDTGNSNSTYSVNIGAIDLDCIGYFMGLTNAPVHSVREASPEHDTWLCSFWDYVNDLTSVGRTSSDELTPLQGSMSLLTEEVLDEGHFHSLNIYRVTHMPTPHESLFPSYISPHDFNDGPYIVRSDSTVDQLLCDAIPGLHSVERDCVPWSLWKEESNLQCRPSFIRFLLVLRRISTKSCIKTLFSGLDDRMLDTVLELICKYIMITDDDNLNPDALNIIKVLPIWRHANGKLSGRLSIEEGLFCVYSTLMTPWVRDLAKFVMPSVVSKHGLFLERLHVDIIDVAEFWAQYKTDLPLTCSNADERSAHKEFVRTLCSEVQVTEEKLIPSGKGVLRKCSSFLDHEDQLFQKALAQWKDEAFPHEDFWELRDFIKENGLRCIKDDGRYRSYDLIICASVISRNANKSPGSPDFNYCAEKIAQMLKYDHVDLREWSTKSWAQLSLIPIFETSRSFDREPAYRQARMTELAQGKRYVTLQEIVSWSKMRTCWSQLPCLEHEPAKFVLSQISHAGTPRLNQVYDHLLYMVNICDMIDDSDIDCFLEDVKACYNRFAADSKAMARLPDIQTKVIWFNLETSDSSKLTSKHLKESLLPAKYLCFNAPYNTDTMLKINRFLASYDALFGELGCPTFAQPPAAAPRPTKDDHRSALLGKLQEFRQASKFTDLLIEAEGQRVPVHRLTLAMSSKYYDAMFSHDWAEAGVSMPVLEFEFGDAKLTTLNCIIDFAYGSDYKGPALPTEVTDVDDIANTLDEILDVLICADALDMPRLQEQVEDFLVMPDNARYYVRADNVNEVRSIAHSANAIVLVEHCDRYLEVNRTAMKRMEATTSI